jgi:hypothetical protein
MKAILISIIFLPILGYGQMMDDFRRYIRADTVKFDTIRYLEDMVRESWCDSSADIRYDLEDLIIIDKCEIRGHVWTPHYVTDLVYYPNEARLVDSDSMTVMIYPAKYSFEKCVRCGEIKKTKESDEIHKLLWRKK